MAKERYARKTVTIMLSSLSYIHANAPLFLPLKELSPKVFTLLHRSYERDHNRMWMPLLQASPHITAHRVHHVVVSYHISEFLALRLQHSATFTFAIFIIVWVHGLQPLILCVVSPGYKYTANRKIPKVRSTAAAFL